MYGAELLDNLAKDLTAQFGKGFSRSNLFQVRLFYLKFPKIQTLSGKLSWSVSTRKSGSLPQPLPKSSISRTGTPATKDLHCRRPFAHYTLHA